MRPDLALVMKEVDATAWCDRIRWRGDEVTLSSDIHEFDENDLWGARVVRRWRDDLNAIKVWNRPVTFTVKTYGCTRVDGGVICHATFEVR